MAKRLNVICVCWLCIIIQMFAASLVDAQSKKIEQLQDLMKKVSRPTETTAGFMVKQTTKETLLRNTPDGTKVEFVEVTAGEAVATLTEMVFHEQTEGVIFPGELLWSSQMLAGNLIPVRETTRKPIRVTITPVRGREGAELSFEHNGNFSSYSQSFGPIMNDINTTAANFTFSFSDVQDSNAALLQIGLSAKYLGSKAALALRREKNTYKSIKYLSFDQKYFSAVVDTPSPQGLIHDSDIRRSGVMASLEKRIQEGYGEIAYVSRVTYGRRLIICVSSELGRKDFDDSLNFSYSEGVLSFKGGVTEEIRNKWRKMKVSAVVVGGRADSNLINAFTANPGQLMDNINKFLIDTVAFDKNTVAVPVSFQARYWRDNGECLAAETSDFAGEEVVGYALRSGIWSKYTNPDSPFRIGPPADRLSGDGEMDTGRRWAKLFLNYQASIAPDNRSVTVTFTYRAEEWKKRNNRFDRRNDSVYQVSRPITIYAPDARPIVEIVSPSRGSLEGHIRGQNHGFAPLNIGNPGMVTSARGKCDAPGQSDDRITECRVGYEIVLRLGEGPRVDTEN